MISFVHFFSWVSLIKYLRRVSGVRKYISLLEKSLFSLTQFTVIILLFGIAFGTSIRIKHIIAEHIDEDTMHHKHIDRSFGGRGLLSGIVAQYRFMFADFGPWDDY
jgi:hypothetical protein